MKQAFKTISIIAGIVSIASAVAYLLIYLEETAGFMSKIKNRLSGRKKSEEDLLEEAAELYGEELIEE
jgi:hypothetical protein